MRGALYCVGSLLELLPLTDIKLLESALLRAAAIQPQTNSRSLSLRALSLSLSL